MQELEAHQHQTIDSSLVLVPHVAGHSQVVILGPTVPSLLVYKRLSRSSSLAMDEQQHSEIGI